MDTDSVFLTQYVCCGLVQSEPICDQTEFLHANGTCVTCPACVPGEELSEDCGFGDGGEGVCIPCEERKFSTETGVTPCRTCTQCSLLNRREETACSPSIDSLCGHCLPGLGSITPGKTPDEGCVKMPLRQSREDVEGDGNNGPSGNRSTCCSDPQARQVALAHPGNNI
uniref:TNFR-Cys domain-containing protein n=1 Tax=Neolamprologus brichardi TaxID=32507 RepID=A0A3Q4I4Y3_NEOBR